MKAPEVRQDGGELIYGKADGEDSLELLREFRHQKLMCKARLATVFY